MQGEPGDSMTVKPPSGCSYSGGSSEPLCAAFTTRPSGGVDATIGTIMTRSLRGPSSGFEIGSIKGSARKSAGNMTRNTAMRVPGEIPQNSGVRRLGRGKDARTWHSCHAPPWPFAEAD